MCVGNWPENDKMGTRVDLFLVYCVRFAHAHAVAFLLVMIVASVGVVVQLFLRICACNAACVVCAALFLLHSLFTMAGFDDV